MKKLAAYSILLILGLVLSQLLPTILRGSFGLFSQLVRILTMIGLSYIMIHVGYEFTVDKNNLRKYGWDYLVAMTAAAFPWILVALYFVFVMLPPEFWANFDTWKETLLAGRFAAPTSAGVLFAMLAAAGLGGTWLYRKARVLAIFDDLDTVLLMIPLKMLMVGLAWQLGVAVLVMAVFLWVAWRWMHKIKLSINWPWVLTYAVVISVASEFLYKFSKLIDDTVPIHIEVLLPAFVIGVIVAYPKKSDGTEDHSFLDNKKEKEVAGIVSGIFMVLVGLNMPLVFNIGGVAVKSASEMLGILSRQPMPGWDVIALHVIVVTAISNIGKMFPAFCYRKEAHWRERLAVAIGMWPRGEVGAGVLVVSLSYGIGGPIVTVAMLSLALNLLLTGVFILIVRKLLRGVPEHKDMPPESSAPY